MDGKSKQNAQNKQRNKSTPTAIYIPTTPAEWSAVGAVVSAGVNAAKAAADLAKGRKPGAKQPLDVTVLRSESLDDAYRLEFLLKNPTEHGIYVESLYLLQPGAPAETIRLLPFTIEKEKTSGITFGGDPQNGAVRWHPEWIGPGKQWRADIRVKHDAKLWFDRAKFGIARARISICSEDHPREVEWVFRIRHIDESS